MCCVHLSCLHNTIHYHVVTSNQGAGSVKTCLDSSHPPNTIRVVLHSIEILFLRWLEIPRFQRRRDLKLSVGQVQG